MQPRTDLAAAASLPLAGCTQLEAISSDREKAGHRWQRRHRTRPVRRRHPADLPRVVRRRGAARRSRRPRGPLRARRGVRSDRGRRRRRRRRPRRGALAGGPPRQLADAVRRRLRRRLRPRHVRGALLPGHAHVPPEILHGLAAIEALALPAGLEGIQPADYIYVGLLVVGMGPSMPAGN